MPKSRGFFLALCGGLCIREVWLAYSNPAQNTNVLSRLEYITIQYLEKEAVFHPHG